MASSRPVSVQRLGGAAFVASGALFLGESVVELVTGPPPATGAEILAWVAAHRALLMVSNELLFFAVVALVPALVALHRSLAPKHDASAALGCGVIALALPVLAVLLTVHARLFYPVFGLQVRTPEVAELVVATYRGGLHVVALLFALGTAVLSGAMRGSPDSRRVAHLGFATAALDVVGSYPDRVGPTMSFVCGVAFAAWLCVVGATMRAQVTDAK